MFAAIQRPPAENQYQLSVPLIDNQALNRSSPPGPMSPRGSVEVAFTERNVREKGLVLLQLFKPPSPAASKVP